MNRGPFGAPRARPVLKKIFEQYGAQSGVWVCPESTNMIFVCLAGGGGGGGAGGNSTGHGGGGASYAEEWVKVIPGNTYTYSIGAGGASLSNGGATGLYLNGQPTIELLGGRAGVAGPTSTGGRGTGLGASGGDGSATNGAAGGSYFNGAGALTRGDISRSYPIDPLDPTSLTYTAGAGGISGGFGTGGGGGGAASAYGNGGAAGNGNAAGSNATGYGAGGGGAGGGSLSGGAGTDGLLLIYVIDSL